MTKRLQELIHNFKPEFGNEEHIRISKRYQELCDLEEKLKKKKALELKWRNAKNEVEEFEKKQLIHESDLTHDLEKTLMPQTK